MKIGNLGNKVHRIQCTGFCWPAILKYPYYLKHQSVKWRVWYSYLCLIHFWSLLLQVYLNTELERLQKRCPPPSTGQNSARHIWPSFTRRRLMGRETPIGPERYLNLPARPVLILWTLTALYWQYYVITSWSFKSWPLNRLQLLLSSTITNFNRSHCVSFTSIHDGFRPWWIDYINIVTS